jgi:hypothetical protein
MSVAIRPKRLTPSVPSVDTPTDIVTPSVGFRPEEPETGARDREAPEIHRHRRVESPEAAIGRGHYLEQEFTHGRSRS